MRYDSELATDLARPPYLPDDYVKKGADNGDHWTRWFLPCRVADFQRLRSSRNYPAHRGILPRPVGSGFCKAAQQRETIDAALWRLKRRERPDAPDLSDPACGGLQSRGAE